MATQNESGINLGKVAGYVGAATGIMSSVQKGKAVVKDIEARSKARVDSMESVIQSMQLEGNMLVEQLEATDRVLGDKMTARGIQAMKDEARLRAAAAETGTSGGTTDAVIQEAYMTQALDNANLISQNRTERANIKNRITSSLFGYNQKIQSMASGLSVSDSNSAISGVLGAMTGYQQYRSYLSDEDKQDMATSWTNAFSTETKRG